MTYVVGGFFPSSALFIESGSSCDEGRLMQLLDSLNEDEDYFHIYDPSSGNRVELRRLGSGEIEVEYKIPSEAASFFEALPRAEFSGFFANVWQRAAQVHESGLRREEW